MAEKKEIFNTIKRAKTKTMIEEKNRNSYSEFISQWVVKELSVSGQKLITEFFRYFEKKECLSHKNLPFEAFNDLEKVNLS